MKVTLLITWSSFNKSKERIHNKLYSYFKQTTYLYFVSHVSVMHTQPEGEFGFNTNIFYKIPKKSFLGGKYGTKLNLNFARTNSIQGGTSFLNDVDSLTHN